MNEYDTQSTHVRHHSWAAVDTRFERSAYLFQRFNLKAVVSMPVWKY